LRGRPSAAASAINSHHCESKGPEILIKKFLFTAARRFFTIPGCQRENKKRPAESTQTKCKRANFTHLALLISFMVLLLQRAHTNMQRESAVKVWPETCYCRFYSFAIRNASVPHAVVCLLASALSLAEVKIHNAH
jgi:hypothetical protein